LRVISKRAAQPPARYGLAALLPEWLPVIADQLTFVANLICLQLVLFSILLAHGEVVRYAL